MKREGLVWKRGACLQEGVAYWEERGLNCKREVLTAMREVLTCMGRG